MGGIKNYFVIENIRRGVHFAWENATPRERVRITMALIGTLSGVGVGIWGILSIGFAGIVFGVPVFCFCMLLSLIPIAFIPPTTDEAAKTKKKKRLLRAEREKTTSIIKTMIGCVFWLAGFAIVVAVVIFAAWFIISGIRWAWDNPITFG